ncbi:geranylgeranylglycerol-phosphate geranylgeranyltransferase [Lutibacter sp.]|uniref:geranylgeranylglycerol-phosphate geranylgeranyltransferase n=1 Tax=Lutibacter sp. TaxID=1925666 RepID=UPI001A2F4F83|nr:geranylgeranylglycerol-phosphate geranylgeranyltransferase [Lutibacter sp.]MBI9042439.1 geranylgeranylglycerol-phosphate geranylgeranyltransferase [Lutibacter sp.]
MQLSAFLNLIRWKNLLLIVYIQTVIKYLFFPNFSIATNLNHFYFSIFLLAILCITVAGYIINDILDVETDKINKPSKVFITTVFTEENARKWYLYLNTFGIGLGILISLKIQKPYLSFIFIGTALLLYYYSKKLKSLPLIGNFIVAVLVATNVLILVIFDLNMTEYNPNYNFVITTILIIAFFAFCINLIRELIKDIEDIDGDYKLKMNTLPILIGRRRTKSIITILCAFSLLLLVFFSTIFASEYKIISLYTIAFIIIPMFYITLKITKIKSKKKLHKISSLLKLVMFFGINIFIILYFTK